MACCSKGPISFIKKHWSLVIVFGAVLHYMFFGGFIYSYNLLYLELRKSFNSTATQTGVPGAISISLLSWCSTVVTFLFQKLGHRATVFIGVTLCCLGLLISSFAQTISILYVTYGVFYGLGFSLTYITIVDLIMRNFNKRNATRATCSALIGMSLGLLCAPWIEWMYQTYSWRITLRIISGGLALVGYSSGLLMIEMKPTHVKLSKNGENDKCTGIDDSVKDDEYVETYTHTLSNKEICTLENKIDTKSEVDIIRKKSCIAKYIVVLRRRDFTIALPGFLLAATATMFTYISVGNFLFEAGMDTDHIALVIVWMGIGDLTGRIIAAVFSDGLPISRTFQYALSNIVAAAPSVALPFISSSSGLTAAMIIMSIPRAILNVLLPSVAMEISSDETLSEAVALIYMAFGIGTFITPFFTDTLFDNTGSYDMPWFICTTLYLISAVFLFLAVYAKRQYERTSIQNYDRVEKDDCEIAKTELQ